MHLSRSWRRLTSILPASESKCFIYWIKAASLWPSFIRCFLLMRVAPSQVDPPRDKWWPQPWPLAWWRRVCYNNVPAHSPPCLLISFSALTCMTYRPWRGPSLGSIRLTNCLAPSQRVLTVQILARMTIFLGEVGDVPLALTLATLPSTLAPLTLNSGNNLSFKRDCRGSAPVYFCSCHFRRRRDHSIISGHVYCMNNNMEDSTWCLPCRSHVQKSLIQLRIPGNSELPSWWS